MHLSRYGTPFECRMNTWLHKLTRVEPAEPVNKSLIRKLGFLDLVSIRLFIWFFQRPFNPDPYIILAEEF